MPDIDHAQPLATSPPSQTTAAALTFSGTEACWKPRSHLPVSGYVICSGSYLEQDQQDEQGAWRTSLINSPKGRVGQ